MSGPPKLVGLLYEAWDELDQSIGGLSEEDAMDAGHGSSFAWTYGHATQQVDGWVNVRFAGHQPNEVLNHLRVGGSGIVADWPAVQSAVAEVRASASPYLDQQDDEALERVIPYDGTFEVLHERGISLRYALMRAIAHHYFHIGEIATKRRAMGQEPGDYPRLLLRAH